MKKENTEEEKLIERSTYALGKGASAVFFLLPGRGSAAVRRKRLFSFSVPGIRGMPRQSRRAFWEGEEGGAARPFARLCSVGARAGRGSGTGSEPLKNEMDILHMGEAGLWAVPPVMTKARLRAKAHACGEGGMPTEPDGTGPQLRRGEGGAIRTGVMSVRRIPVRRPLIAHGEEVCAGTSVQGGQFFLVPVSGLFCGRGIPESQAPSAIHGRSFCAGGDFPGGAGSAEPFAAGRQGGGCAGAEAVRFRERSPACGPLVPSFAGHEKAPRNTSAGPCMTEGGGRGKAL